MISTLSRSLSLAFSRIQFTPDLMPSDITGTEIIEENRSTGAREFKFLQGPLFANVILADEINRTPPKTQAALLEAMQERQVTVGRVRHRLDAPFFVLATQNPIEQEGTYPLPEAKQDRFMFKVFVKYPKFEEEFEIARRTTALLAEDITPVLSGEQILELQRMVRKVPVTDEIIRYTLALVRQTRIGEPGVPKFVRDWLSWGAGPRAVQYLILGGKARALLYGRVHVNTEDIQALAYPVLRHRILTNFTAASTAPATTSATSTGRSGPRPTATTSSSSRPRPTSARTSSLTSASRCTMGTGHSTSTSMPAPLAPASPTCCCASRTRSA